MGSVSLRCALFANVAFWLASLLNFYFDYLSNRIVFGSDRQNQISASGGFPRRLQPDRWFSAKDVRDIILLAGFNMIVVAPLIVPAFELVWDAMYPSPLRLHESDPWVWQRELSRIPLDMLLNETLFYAAHYVLHKSTFLYKHVHKVHHRFQNPTSAAAAYAHPIEFIFGNVGAIAAGPILTNAHPYTSYAWFTMAILSTCKGHSGYDILNAKTHDDHHRYTHSNFGVLHLGDFLLKTRLIDASEVQRKPDRTKTKQ